MSELIQNRQRSPWLWNDVLYSLTPSGREHNKCLTILHDFTNKVIKLHILTFVKVFSLLGEMTWCKLKTLLPYKVIDERIAERAAKKSLSQEQKNEEESEDGDVFKGKKRLAFLDLLLEAYDNGEISREGVREEVDTFMFEVRVYRISSNNSRSDYY